MKKNIAAIVQYEGTRYSGWQKQGNTKDTIQGKLEHILSVLAGESIAVIGSGRTDAGVHAAGQHINFHIDTAMSPGEIMDYINKYLPDDIGVIKAWEADERFHSRLSATKKTYSYKIHTGNIPDVFTSRYSWQYKGSLDTAAMKAAAGCLVGKHDFQSFTDLKRSKKSTVRTIESINITESPSKICLDITGDSFLYHMIRIIVGTLVEIGEEKRSLSDMPALLEAGSRQLAGFLAPPCGLMLMQVFY